MNFENQSSTLNASLLTKSLKLDKQMFNKSHNCLDLDFALCHNYGCLYCRYRT
jgi:hypothetical protein